MKNLNGLSTMGKINILIRAYLKLAPIQTKVVTDIVQNYDIDAIHFDDYFYPYKMKGQEFDDQRSFKNHGGDFIPIN